MSFLSQQIFFFLLFLANVILCILHKSAGFCRYNVSGSFNRSGEKVIAVFLQEMDVEFTYIMYFALDLQCLSYKRYYK